jgi:hypothetical protein
LMMGFGVIEEEPKVKPVPAIQVVPEQPKMPVLPSVPVPQRLQNSPQQIPAENKGNIEIKGEVDCVAVSSRQGDKNSVRMEGMKPYKFRMKPGAEVMFILAWGDDKAKYVRIYRAPNGKSYVTYYSANGDPAHLDLLPAQTYHIGRRFGSEIQIDHKNISLDQCTITMQDAGEVEVRDLNSMNGTWVQWYQEKPRKGVIAHIRDWMKGSKGNAV